MADRIAEIDAQLAKLRVIRETADAPGDDVMAGFVADLLIARLEGERRDVLRIRAMERAGLRNCLEAQTD